MKKGILVGIVLTLIAGLIVYNLLYIREINRKVNRNQSNLRLVVEKHNDLADAVKDFEESKKRW